MDPRKEVYAINELMAVCNETLNEINIKYTEKAKTLTAFQRCKLIERGKVFLKNGITEVQPNDEISDVFDFTKFEYSAKANQEKIDSLTSQVKITYKTIKDTVAIGGDEENALSILKEFRAFCNQILEAE